MSDSVMRLVRTDESKYVQTKEGSTTDEYRSVSKASADDSKPAATNYFADILLKRRSLYIMKLVDECNLTESDLFVVFFSEIRRATILPTKFEPVISPYFGAN